MFLCNVVSYVCIDCGRDLWPVSPSLVAVITDRKLHLYKEDTISPVTYWKVNFHFFLNKAEEEKTAEGEQREELESDLADVALQAEESPPTTTAEDNEPTESQEDLREDAPVETQQTVSPPRTHPGRGRPTKLAPLSAHKKISVKKEDGDTKSAPEYQDDPSDADYTPSKYTFIEICVNIWKPTAHMRCITVVWYVLMLLFLI